MKAVILAAGSGSRFKHQGVLTPKPLIRLGGLSLLERTIHTASKAGASEFLIVLGAQAESIRSALEQRLSAFPVRWILNERWSAGNGTSVLAAEPFVNRNECFLVLMADHLLFAPTLRRLMAQASQGPDCVLAIDRKTSSVIDVADATKVHLQGRRVLELDKALVQYDALDIGASVCNAAFFDALRDAASRQQGNCSHSDGMRALIKNQLLAAHDIGEDVWEDVDSPEAHQAAEKVLFESLRKPTDGFMSRHLQRRLSLAFTRRLMNTRLTPNQVTLAIVALGVVAAGLFAQPGYGPKVLGALLFWCSSFLDGCDGELSRLKFMETRLGGWLDLWSDNIVHMLVFIGISLGLFRDRQDPLWLYLGAAAALGVLLSVSWVSWTLSKQKKSQGPLYTGVGELSSQETGWIVRLTELANALSRRDFIFGAIFLALLGWLPWFLWAAAVGSNIYWLLLLAIAFGKHRHSKPVVGDWS